MLALQLQLLRKKLPQLNLLKKFNKKKLHLRLPLPLRTEIELLPLPLPIRFLLKSAFLSLEFKELDLMEELLLPTFMRLKEKLQLLKNLLKLLLPKPSEAELPCSKICQFPESERQSRRD